MCPRPGLNPRTEAWLPETYGAMTLLLENQLPSTVPVPTPPARPRGRRALSAVRLVVGWLLVAIALAVPFASIETLNEPVVDCGASSFQVLLNGAGGPRAADCRSAASSEVLGAVFLCLLPGIGLLAGRRLRRWG